MIAAAGANLAPMEKPKREHDAAPVELAAGWIAICATCGWVAESYGTQQRAEAESARHVAETRGDRQPLRAF